MVNNGIVFTSRNVMILKEYHGSMISESGGGGVQGRVTAKNCNLEHLCAFVSTRNPPPPSPDPILDPPM